MKFEDRHVLNKPAADVIKMYTDQKFFERKYKDLGAWDIQVLECKKDAKKFLIKCRYTIKSSHPSIPAFAQAHGSMWFALLPVLPFALLQPMRAAPAWGDWGAVLAIALMCTGWAYLIYFRLVASIGPARTPGGDGPG